MKKLKLMFACMMMSATLLSCSSEEKTVQQENAKNAEFAKTAEMLNFESSLKEWMQAKRENAGSTSRSAIDNQITSDAKALLLTFGDHETAKHEQTTEALVRVAMKAYSQKLTEQYRAQNN